MKPLRTTALVLGTVTLVAAGYYFVQQRTTSKTQSTTTPTAAATHRASDHGIGSARRPEFHLNTGDRSNKLAAAKPTSSSSKRTSAKRLQCPDNIPTQRFCVKAEKGSVIKTAGGCTVQVPANAFVDASGKQVKGAVSVDVKEVLKPVDYVMGNMMTLYEGKPLESGGTFSITASANGRELFLADNAALNMAVPSRAKKNGMKFFPGKEASNGVVWQAPEELKAPLPVETNEVDVPDVNMEKVMRTNVTYRVIGFDNPSEAPSEVHAEVSRIAWQGDGLWIKRDSNFMVGKYEVEFIANPRVTSTNAGGIMILDQVSSSSIREEGVNTFQVDPDANYIFQVKKLGWANIDRLLYDKRTQPVDMITRVTNDEGMNDLCITLVMKSHGLYIPGYKRKDGHYGFSHGDFEPMKLPVGAKAKVLCTAKKDGKTWYALQDITIAATGTIDITLQPTVTDDLRKVLMASL